MTGNSFDSRATLTAAGTSYEIYRLDAVPGAERLPFSLKILLENLLRTEDGVNVTAGHVRALADWDAKAEPDTEIQFSPARILMQDLTGVPAVVDLAAMRDAMEALGGDAVEDQPAGPGRAGHRPFGHRRRLRRRRTPSRATSDFEFERNNERYQFLRWGQSAFDEFKVVPPGTGICHQVNLEHLARVVMTSDGDGAAPTRTPASAPTRTPRW